MPLRGRRTAPAAPTRKRERDTAFADDDAVVEPAATAGGAGNIVPRRRAGVSEAVPFTQAAPAPDVEAPCEMEVRMV